MTLSTVHYAFSFSVSVPIVSLLSILRIISITKMRSADNYSMMRLKHFVNDAGVKQRFFKPVYVRCPSKWAHHPTVKDFIARVKQIILENWDQSHKDVHLTACNIRTKMITQSTWEYWFVPIGEGEDSDDEHMNSMPQLQPEVTPAESSLSRRINDQCTPPLLTRQDEVEVKQEEVEMKQEEVEVKQEEEEVCSNAETVIAEHTAHSIIKNEVDISDNETFFEPDIEEEESKHEILQDNIISACEAKGGMVETPRVASMTSSVTCGAEGIQQGRALEGGQPAASTSIAFVTNDAIRNDEIMVGEGAEEWKQTAENANNALPVSDAIRTDEMMNDNAVREEEWEQLSDNEYGPAYYRGMFRI